MRSLFVNAPFSKFDLGHHVLVGGLGLPKRRLGQESAYALDDYLQKIGNVTDKETREKLKKKYDECLEKDGIAEATCYVALTAELYAASKQESSKPPTTLPVAPPQAASSFPIVPVAIASVAALGLIWFLVSKGKK
jgi:hypothetical protein